MTKRARISVDCCGEIRRIIRPLKSDFPSQTAGIFTQCSEEVLILALRDSVFFTTSMKHEFEEFQNW